MNQSSLAFESLVREAIAACRAAKRKAPQNGPDIALRLHEAAAQEAAQGRYGQAEELHHQALAIREQALDERHPLVAGSLLMLAGLYQKEGRPMVAEPLVRRALAIRQRALGPDHGAVAECLDILADLYSHMGRAGDARLLAARSAEIRSFAPVPKNEMHEALPA